MKKIVATFSVVALVALGTVFVFGQTGVGNTDGKRGFGHHGKRAGFGGRMKGRKHMKRMFRQLDLTDEQKTQMKQIAQSSREKIKPIRQQVRENKQTLRGLTDGGNFDEAQVQAVAAQLGSLHAQMIVEKERTKAAMIAILTPEQKAKMAQLKQEFKEKREARKARFKERKEASEKTDN